MNELLNAASLIIGIICVIICIKEILNWDGDTSCDETQCSTCPFPCEKHVNK
ncbi:MAG: hypothetical protein IKB64_09105 [Paludibacteraceae bacterium]|nr:hypothetical protein [Paludibacteraceae bacterium]